MHINKRALVTKLRIALIGILISADLLAQSAPAFVEWQQATPAIGVPTSGGVMLALLGIALLAFGIHLIWRHRSTAARLMAIVAIASGTLLSVQGAPQLVLGLPVRK